MNPGLWIERMRFAVLFVICPVGILSSSGCAVTTPQASYMDLKPARIVNDGMTTLILQTGRLGCPKGTGRVVGFVPMIGLAMTGCWHATEAGAHIEWEPEATDVGPADVKLEPMESPAVPAVDPDKGA